MGTTVIWRCCLPGICYKNKKYISRSLITHACMLSRFSHVRLWDSMDGSLSGSSVHEILQARVLASVATPSSRGSSQPRDQTHVSFIAGRFFTAEPLGKLVLITHTTVTMQGERCVNWFDGGNHFAVDDMSQQSLYTLKRYTISVHPRKGKRKEVTGKFYVVNGKGGSKGWQSVRYVGLGSPARESRTNTEVVGHTLGWVMGGGTGF